jgi:hypothetical protein
MTKRLGESDRRAVDLLLDRTTDAGNGNGNGGYVAHAQPATEPGIQAVQRVLSLLDVMPADEPAADLIARTMARIDSRAGVAAQPLHPATAAMMTNRPHA